MDTAFVVDRIRDFTKKTGVKMQFLCSSVGVRNTYFSDCKSKGLKISDEVLGNTARCLGTTVAYLTGETDDPNFHLSSVGMTTHKYEKSGSRPVYGHTSAGNGVFADQQVLGYEAVDEEYDTDEFFWLEVSGDSMAPTFIDGDLVLVHRDMPVESSAIMVVIIDDMDGVIKKVSVDDDSVTLLSFNPYYPPKVFGGSELGRLRFVGKVVEQKRRF